MKNIIFYRRGFGLSQEYMAKRLGIERTTYGKKESGKLNFTADEKDKVVEVIQEYDPKLTHKDIFLL